MSSPWPCWSAGQGIRIVLESPVHVQGEGGMYLPWGEGMREDKLFVSVSVYGSSFEEWKQRRAEPLLLRALTRYVCPLHHQAQWLLKCERHQRHVMLAI